MRIQPNKGKKRRTDQLLARDRHNGPGWYEMGCRAEGINGAESKIRLRHFVLGNSPGNQQMFEEIVICFSRI